MIQEGNATLNVPPGNQKKNDPVFFNPHMKLNRDINISLINALNTPLKMCDLLAGSGARGIRILLESSSLEHCTFIDINKRATKIIENNCKINKISPQQYSIINAGAITTLLESQGFDYIDIDPFGSPNSYLDIACKRMHKNGLLAVTATDTSALCGTYINACKRKYWATPSHNAVMHEIGIRILIRKIQLIAAQYERAAIPLFCHSSRHYMRVYFQFYKGKKKVDAVLKNHGMFNMTGPMWLGALWDTTLVKKMKSDDITAQNFINTIKNESCIKTVGFYDTHELCSSLKINVPSTKSILNEIKKKKEKATITHFSQYGIRTTMALEKFCALLKKLNNK